MNEVIFIRDKGLNQGTKALQAKLWRAFNTNEDIANRAIARSNRGGEPMSVAEEDAVASYNTAKFELAFLRGDKRFLEGFKHFLDGTGPFEGMNVSEGSIK